MKLDEGLNCVELRTVALVLEHPDLLLSVVRLTVCRGVDGSPVEEEDSVEPLGLRGELEFLEKLVHVFHELYILGATSPNTEMDELIVLDCCNRLVVSAFAVFDYRGFFRSVGPGVVVSTVLVC